MGVTAIRMSTSISSDLCESLTLACLLLPPYLPTACQRHVVVCSPVYDCYILLPDGVNRNIKLAGLTQRWLT